MNKHSRRSSVNQQRRSQWPWEPAKCKGTLLFLIWPMLCQVMRRKEIVWAAHEWTITWRIFWSSAFVLHHFEHFVYLQNSTLKSHTCWNAMSGIPKWFWHYDRSWKWQKYTKTVGIIRLLFQHILLTIRVQSSWPSDEREITEVYNILSDKNCNHMCKRNKLLRYIACSWIQWTRWKT